MKNDMFRLLNLKEMKEILDKVELKEEYLNAHPHFIAKELDEEINCEILKQLKYGKEKTK